MMTKPKLFGTDGVRGIAGEFPLDRETVFGLGLALGVTLEKHGGNQSPRVVLGEDTRESSAWISRALAAGLRASGVDVAYAGVITTPGIAFLSRQPEFVGGVMVSASHNPYRDNGIKVLSHEGMKLAESLEVEIETLLDSGSTGVSPVFRHGQDGRATASSDDALLPLPQLLEQYEEFLSTLAPPKGWRRNYRVVLDCANGAANRVAPPLMKRLAIEAEAISAQPDGRNINLDCGSLHPQQMAETTRALEADLGVAFDGDADRAIFATRDGRVVDGDHVLYAAASFFQDQGKLKGGAVVGTLMTNLGLELALARRGIGLKRTPVGDKYVLEEMLRSGSNLGGEPSGHIIFSDVSLAGDGIITLLEVLRLLDSTGKSLSELVSPLAQCPQIILNVRVREKVPLESIFEVNSAVNDFRREVGERGRVVVRYSGTEPLARVMVEAEDAGTVERHASRIASAIESVLGIR